MRGVGVACSAVGPVGVVPPASLAVCALTVGEQTDKYASANAPRNTLDFMDVLLEKRLAESTFSPPQFAAQDFVIGQSRRAHKLYLGFRLGDYHAVFWLELKADLPIELKKNWLARFDEIEFDSRGVRHDERAIRQHVRAYRRDHERVEGRMNNW